MKSNIDLLNMYKEEKALIVGDENERTGLEPFPTFAQWKEVYTMEYNETHKTVTVEEADAEFDAAVDEADAELQAIIAELGDVEDPATAKRTVTKTKRKVRPSAKTGKVSRAKVKRAVRKVAKKKPRKTAIRKLKRAPDDVRRAAKKKSRRKSKIEKAKTIFNRFYGRKTRGEIIDKFVAQVGLTEAGAATYYQKLKRNQ